MTVSLPMCVPAPSPGGSETTANRNRLWNALIRSPRGYQLVVRPQFGVLIHQRLHLVQPLAHQGAGYQHYLGQSCSRQLHKPREPSLPHRLVTRGRATCQTPERLQPGSSSSSRSVSSEPNGTSHSSSSMADSEPRVTGPFNTSYADSAVLNTHCPPTGSGSPAANSLRSSPTRHNTETAACRTRALLEHSSAIPLASTALTRRPHSAKSRPPTAVVCPSLGSATRSRSAASRRPRRSRNTCRKPPFRSRVSPTLPSCTLASNALATASMLLVIIVISHCCPFQHTTHHRCLSSARLSPAHRRCWWC
ncbi:hypothetical protein DL89DRAFT_92632 [Linderina pennispora]|uniref:Uncharacterized protein n=1 Tax=Linderina pennispora TaxID=61395 RepID=A0A1Y1VWZ1_9FUNG|nr:uncharacterized protein DL89DRAFT_92632 [Linderina pennispora]ORX65827.1 hypothetical protein DL89DRAFT_92632 [Linderina pennispora]